MFLSLSFPLIEIVARTRKIKCDDDGRTGCSGFPSIDAMTAIIQRSLVLALLVLGGFTLFEGLLVPTL